MICHAEYIEQPRSGEYTEKIYDIESPWNSSNWTWIKFEDENGEWCGEFRGEYRGVSVSEKLGIVIVLTSDYMIILDINSAEMIEYDLGTDYTDITTSPMGDVLVTDGLHIEMLVNDGGKIGSTVVSYIPVNPDDLRFVEWKDTVLKICCQEFLKWDKEIELYLDLRTMKWIGGDCKLFCVN